MDSLTTIDIEKQRFELEQKKSKAFAISAFFPQHLRGANLNVALANATIVYDLAYRMHLSPLEVAQSIFIIHGKPSFETKFLVAMLNRSGLLKGRLRTVISKDEQSAYSIGIDSETGEEYKGTTITMDMAKKEGWLSKSGSKWQTMPTLMLRYRAQSFFINEFYPEVKLGVKTKEEILDTIDTDDTEDIDLNEIETPKDEHIDLNEINKPLEIEVLPHEKLSNELIDRGLTSEEAERITLKYSKEQVEQILNDPASIDSIMEA